MQSTADACAHRRTYAPNLHMTPHRRIQKALYLSGLHSLHYRHPPNPPKEQASRCSENRSLFPRVPLETPSPGLVLKGLFRSPQTRLARDSLSPSGGFICIPMVMRLRDYHSQIITLKGASIARAPKQYSFIKYVHKNFNH